ncbi:MAG: SLBB domain-containing protein [candidate division WOR-3 bacterium]
MFQLVLGFFLFNQVVGGTGTGGSIAPTSAQTGVAQGALDRPVISDEYVLMPGDECLTHISGGTHYTYPFTVSYEGKAIIVLPVGVTYSPVLGETRKTETIGAVKISGLTIKQAEDSLTRVFSKYFKNVSVDLTLVGMRTFNVFVSGEVRYPGIVNAYPVDRISEIVKRAGGVTAIGSRSNIKLIRSDKTEVNVDIEKFETSGDLGVNPYVQDGDLIIVPSIKGMVTVKGAIFGRGAYELRVSAMTTERERVSEGIYEIKEGDRISDLIKRAGGVTPWADLNAGYIDRLKPGSINREKIPIDLYKILIDRDQEKDIEVINGDILVIPPKNSYVYVMGEIANPGPYPYQPNLRMSDYIAMAGVKTTGDQYPKIKGSKLKRGKKKFSYRDNPVVEPGDEIFVPRVTFKFWQDYLQIASVATTILISYLTLSKL